VLKRLIVILLIIGWISLSGFDLIEDLNEISGQVTVSVNSPDDSSTAKRGGWGPLANNIVESAGPTQRVDVAAISFPATVFEFEQVFDFRRHIPLHKLYRVFLI